ncbi:MAG: hypothetical protein MI861_16450 [Pirellulales bacterium]|nr:hypothetical protein [Pirellulales bacterium]
MSSVKLGGGLLAIGLAVALAVHWFADRGYGEISPLGYQYATALYSCCNQCDQERLEKISQMIDESHQKQELDAKEKGWLLAIIQQGRQGQWESAAAEVRALMVDQVQGI